MEDAALSRLRCDPNLPAVAMDITATAGRLCRLVRVALVVVCQPQAEAPWLSIPRGETRQLEHVDAAAGDAPNRSHRSPVAGCPHHDRVMLPEVLPWLAIRIGE